MPLALSVAATLLVSCGTSAGGSFAPPSSPGASGCSKPASPGSTTITVTTQGRSRLAIVHVPSGYSGMTQVPLVLNMHGSGATAADQEAFSGMDATADRSGFLVAYPQALIPDGTGFDWNVPGVPLTGGRSVPAGSADDVSFLTTLVSTMEAHYCVDPSRVYATGFSGGARMTSQLACDASSTFAAVAPVSGLRHPTPCPASRAVPVISFHGTADPVDPYAGDGEAYWSYSVPQAADDWAVQDQCATTPSTSAEDGYSLTEYSGCAAGSTVELYSVTGEGHEWPGGPKVPRALSNVLGPQSSAIDADSLIWSFFAGHADPGAAVHGG